MKKYEKMSLTFGGRGSYLPFYSYNLGGWTPPVYYVLKKWTPPVDYNLKKGVPHKHESSQKKNKIHYKTASSIFLMFCLANL